MPSVGTSRETISGLLAGGLFLLAGPVAGLVAAQHVGGGAALATVASVAMLPVAFLAGNGAWTMYILAFAAASGVAKLLKRRRGETTPPAPPVGPEREDLPGAWIWIPVVTAVSLVAGVLSGAPAGGWGVMDAAGAYGAAGLAVGIVMWRLGRTGVIEPLIFS
jgi:hypothetical protein